MLTKQQRTKLEQQADALHERVHTLWDTAALDDSISLDVYQHIGKVRRQAQERYWRRQALPLDRGELDSYAWPGGYPILYYTKEGNVLCADCARTDEEDSTPDIYYEGPTVQCEGCNKELESAYGDPDEEDN